MKRRVVVALLAASLLVIAACEQETPLSPPAGESGTARVSLEPAQVAAAMMASAGWPAIDDAGNPVAGEPAPGVAAEKCQLDFVGRELLTADVAHYTFRLRVGAGQYDVIGVHRVVRESRPQRPIRTRANLFLQHGDYKDFTGCYLPGRLSPRQPDDEGFAVFLAQHDVDVWGIDQAWTLVPPEETDLSFMAGWDMQRQVDDLLTAMQVAQQVRHMSGNGTKTLLLSGYSTGGPIGFAALNQETQLPPGRRVIGGFIPVDQGLKTDDPAWAAVCEGVCAGYQAMLDAGQYQENNPFPYFGELALDHPDEMSPDYAGVTNYQVALILGAMPFFDGVAAHFFASIFDQDGLPTGFQFVDPDDWIDFLYYAPAYEPAAYLRDEYMPSYTDATPYDDHLGEITVPVLFVKARGGFGSTGVYTLELLGSTDTAVLEAALGVDDILLEYGHVDLFLASDAQTRMWEPVLAWVVDHTRPGHH